MTQWTAIARVEDLPPGSYLQMEVDGITMAIFNVDGRYYAIEDICSHEAETLSGEIFGVNFGEENFSCCLRCCLAEFGCHHHAWTAPRCPEVDDHRESRLRDQIREILR